MKNKQGISSVIVTVLLVLLSVTLVVVVAGFIVPFVRDNLDKSTECLDYKEYFQFEEEFGYNCYDADGFYVLSVGAKTLAVEKSDKVAGFQLVLLKKGESTVFDVDDGADVGEVEMLDDDAAKIEIPESGEVRTYRVSSDEEVESIKMFVKLKSGRVCEEESDSLKVLYETC